MGAASETTTSVAPEHGRLDDETVAWLGGSLNRSDAESFVGPNFERYWRQWRKMSSRSSSISWNWPSAILSVSWLGFRKAHKAAAIALSIFALVFLLFGIFEGATRENALPFFLLAFIASVVVLGLIGDKIYRNRAFAAVQLARAVEPTPDGRAARLRVSGGQSFPGAAVWTVGTYVGLSVAYTIGIGMGAGMNSQIAEKPGARPPTAEVSVACKEIPLRAVRMQRRIDNLKLDYPGTTDWVCRRFKDVNGRPSGEVVATLTASYVLCAAVGTAKDCTYVIKEFIELAQGIDALQTYARNQSCQVPSFPDPC